MIERVREFLDEEVYREVGAIVCKYEIFKCKECAAAVLNWLADYQIEGKLLKLRTRFKDEDFIISARMSKKGMSSSITLNGIHYGVEVRGRVFDNLSEEGMIRNNWVKDFSCVSNQLILVELDSFTSGV